MLYLREDFQKAWDGGDPFAAADKLSGTVFRSVKTRRTLRFEMNGKRFFAKIHHGVGWPEIFKNLLQGKKTIIGAGNEWAALQKLAALNIDTMTPCAFGKRGKNPAGQDSFIITEELQHTISLEDFCKNWPGKPPPLKLKLALIKKLAEVSRKMHGHGMNHRDYYLCHFLLDIPDGTENIDADHFKVYLIDLHRAQIRTRTPQRWIIKDLGGLWFSAMDIGLSRHDCFRFMRVYAGMTLREIFGSSRNFWYEVNRAAARLYKKETGKFPKCAFNKTI